MNVHAASLCVHLHSCPCVVNLIYVGLLWMHPVSPEVCTYVPVTGATAKHPGGQASSRDQTGTLERVSGKTPLNPKLYTIPALLTPRGYAFGLMGGRFGHFHLHDVHFAQELVRVSLKDPS